MDDDLRHELVARKIDEKLELSRRGDTNPEGGRVQYHKPLDLDRIMKDFQK